MKSYDEVILAGILCSSSVVHTRSARRQVVDLKHVDQAPRDGTRVYIFDSPSSQVPRFSAELRTSRLSVLSDASLYPPNSPNMWSHLTPMRPTGPVQLLQSLFTHPSHGLLCPLEPHFIRLEDLEAFSPVLRYANDLTACRDCSAYLICPRISGELLRC